MLRHEKLMLPAGILVVGLVSSISTSAAQSEHAGQGDQTVWRLADKRTEPAERRKDYGWTEGSTKLVDLVIIGPTNFINVRKFVRSGETKKEVTFTFEFKEPPKVFKSGESIPFELSGEASRSAGPAEFAEVATAWFYGEGIDISLKLKLGSMKPKGEQKTTFLVPKSLPDKFKIMAKLGPAKTTWFYERSTLAAGVDFQEWSTTLPAWHTPVAPLADPIYYVPEWLEWIKPTPQKTYTRGRLTVPRGEVWYYSKTFNKWKGPVRGQLTVYNGDRVRTGANASCKIVFVNPEGQQDTILITHDTLVEVPSSPDRLAPPPTWMWTIYQGAVSIKRAAFRAVTVPKRRDPFFVRSPMVCVGVRGTEFVMRHDERSGSTTIYLHTGSLSVTNQVLQGGRNLPAGTRLTITKTGSESLVPMTRSDWQRALTELKLDK